MDDPALATAEVVASLWREARLREEAANTIAAIVVPSRPPMLDDQNLRALQASWPAQGVPTGVLTVLAGMAQRADELAADVALLAAALERAVDRLAARDETFHRLLEDRVEQLEGYAEGP